LVDDNDILMAASFTDETLEPVEFKSTWKRERYSLRNKLKRLPVYLLYARTVWGVTVAGVSVCVWHFDFYKLPKSNLTNANIQCLVRGKSSESVQCAITGPCLRMRHRPSA